MSFADEEIRKAIVRYAKKAGYQVTELTLERLATEPASANFHDEEDIIIYPPHFK